MDTPTRTLRHIYIADDDIDDRKIFTEVLLEQFGDTVILSEAEHGMQLLQMLHAAHNAMPHLVVIDVNMPLINGFECVEQIRKQTHLQSLHLIVLSTSSEPASVDKALKLGADCYAVKPNTMMGWRALVSDLLNTDWLLHKTTKPNFKRTYDAQPAIGTQQQNSIH